MSLKKNILTISLLCTLLLGACSTSKTISGTVVEISNHSPHFVIECGPYSYKMIETNFDVMDTLKIGDYIEFECSKGKKNEIGCLKYML